MRRKTFLHQMAAAAVMGSISPAGFAQSKLTRIVVPYPPGGAADFLARAFAERFQVHLGGPVIIDNRTGGSGAVGELAVARSEPDGYTLLLPAASVLVIKPHVYSNSAYDPLKDLVPVGRIAIGASALFVSGTNPANNAKEFVEWARARNKPVNFGSSGAGGVTHLWIEQFGAATGIKTLHVPYKGVGLAATAVVSGEIDAEFSDIAPLMPLVKAGRLKMLGLVGQSRNASIPDLPTLAEQGIPTLVGVNWYGLFAPAKTPPDVLKRISDSTRKTVDDPVLSNVLKQGIVAPAFLDSASFSDLVRTDYEFWGRVVKQHNIRVE